LKAEVRTADVDGATVAWNERSGAAAGDADRHGLDDGRMGSGAALPGTVRPGLTGPWQVLGRIDIPLEDMIKLGYIYVSTWSPRGNLKLLLRTLGVVFQARGAY
jgi:hypothetical protein